MLLDCLLECFLERSLFITSAKAGNKALSIKTIKIVGSLALSDEDNV